MFVTLALVVFFAAIIVFFSDEFIQLIKKILALKGGLLVIPLALASWLVVVFDFWFMWGITYISECLKSVFMFFKSMMPWHVKGYPVAEIVYLTCISVLPVRLLDWYVRKRTNKPYAYPILASTILWIFNAIIILVGLN